MSAFFNEIILLGNIGKTPELKYFQNGTPFIQISLATTEKYKNQNDEWIENTSWHSIHISGRSAEVIATYMDKGDKLFVKGKIKQKQYTDAKGVKHSTYEVQANQAIMVSSKRKKIDGDLEE